MAYQLQPDNILNDLMIVNLIVHYILVLSFHRLKLTCFEVGLIEHNGVNIQLIFR